MGSDSTVILAVNNPGFLWVQLKPALPEPFTQAVQQESSLPPSTAMKQTIVSIPTPFYSRKVPTPDPSIEGVMQKGIGQNRADNSNNNRANSRVQWGLRIARGCLAPGFAGCPAVEITLVIDVATSIDVEPQP
nr:MULTISPECIES: hypothetical protein [Marinobacter]